ncbi:MAG TPA: hypothetical protein VKA70_15865 [Blastocatellia bacterium]|nr:hypothetical protein [Blastocatellia bacterium]
MNGCKQIKAIIDEAERPEALDYGASQHMASCADCSQFADERAKLKALLAEVGRVSAPADFDFKLKARLAEVKGRRNFLGLSPAGYLKLGGAMAALVIAVVAAQTGGLFTADNTVAPPAEETAAVQPFNPQRTDVVQPMPPAIRSEEPDRVAIAAINVSQRGQRRHVRPAPEPVRAFVTEGGTTVLMRGPAGELEVPVPTVSVGAQSLMYVGSRRHTAHAVSTSF